MKHYRWAPWCAAALWLVAAAAAHADDADASSVTQEGSVLRLETRTQIGRCLIATPPLTDAQAAIADFSPPAAATGGGAPAGAGAGLRAASPRLAAPNRARWSSPQQALVGAAVDLTLAALVAAGQDSSAEAITSFPATGYLYTMTPGALVRVPQDLCVQILSGSFWDGIAIMDGDELSFKAERSELQALDDKASTAIPGYMDSTRFARLDGAEVPLVRWRTWGPSRYAESAEQFHAALRQRFRQVREARFYFEAAILASADRAHLQILPQALYFKEGIKRGFFEAGRRPRSLMVTVSLSQAGSDPDTSFGSVAFTFPDVPPDTLLSPLYFRGQASRTVGLAALSDVDRKHVLQSQEALAQATKDLDGETRMPSGGGTAATPATNPADTPAAAPMTQALLADKEYLRQLARYCNALDARARRQGAALQATFPSTAGTADSTSLCPVEARLAQLAMAWRASVLAQAQDAARAAEHAKRHRAAPNQPVDGVTCGVDRSGKLQCTVKAQDMALVGVRSAVVETRDGSKLAAFLGRVLGGSEDAIDKAVAARSPAARASASLAAQADADAYALALADIRIAQAKLDAVESSPASSASQVEEARKDVIAKT